MTSSVMEQISCLIQNRRTHVAVSCFFLLFFFLAAQLQSHPWALSDTDFAVKILGENDGMQFKSKSNIIIFITKIPTSIFCRMLI